MTITNPAIIYDPVALARRDALHAGQRMMRDRLAAEFAAFAVNHPNPVIADELWSFVHFIRAQVTE